jgi:hypothetical protein
MPGEAKKSSQLASAGAMMRRLPSRLMVTSFTSSGKATSFGSRTAWVLFDLNRVVSTTRHLHVYT